MSTEIRYFENRKDWRKWLADNFDTADGVWFVFPTKSSSEKSIVYNDAVEEAAAKKRLSGPESVRTAKVKKPFKVFQQSERV